MRNPIFLAILAIVLAVPQITSAQEQEPMKEVYYWPWDGVLTDARQLPDLDVAQAQIDSFLKSHSELSFRVSFIGGYTEEAKKDSCARIAQSLEQVFKISSSNVASKTSFASPLKSGQATIYVYVAEVGKVVTTADDARTVATDSSGVAAGRDILSYSSKSPAGMEGGVYCFRDSSTKVLRVGEGFFCQVRYVQGGDSLIYDGPYSIITHPDGVIGAVRGKRGLIKVSALKVGEADLEVQIFSDTLITLTKKFVVRDDGSGGGSPSNLGGPKRAWGPQERGKAGDGEGQGKKHADPRNHYFIGVGYANLDGQSGAYVDFYRTTSINLAYHVGISDFFPTTNMSFGGGLCFDIGDYVTILPVVAGTNFGSEIKTPNFIKAQIHISLSRSPKAACVSICGGINGDINYFLNPSKFEQERNDDVLHTENTAGSFTEHRAYEFFAGIGLTFKF